MSSVGMISWVQPSSQPLRPGRRAGREATLEHSRRQSEKPPLNAINCLQEGPMQISAEDYEQIMNPAARDPETEKRRLEMLRRADELGRELGPLTPERLKAGIPLGLKLRAPKPEE